ncbi:YicC/YloC family endoribonuclease [Hyphomicrobium sp. NDB2Meth4]|uniref:YicC/YloC family endoribonuclease n=1 Tax=Hyphomicrobium sp. NDB2Meth4 TaxID=1892846 RepID=UPI000931FB2F|nr:YicC/YloC family endoribonuclease [Hyphomicrobium sp. NDB2Meth4]
MTIRSMTGFARAEGSLDSASWHWEIRSVNGRGLDVRLRFPSGLEYVEPRVREAVARHVTRGSVNITLVVDRAGAGAEIRLNETALAQVMQAAERIRNLTDAAPPRVDGLIAIKGVLDIIEPQDDPEQQAARADAMLVSLESGLAALVTARTAEGNRLASVLAGQLAEIERLVEVVRTSPARTPQAIEERLKEQVRRILDAGAGSFDPGRLHQEAVLLATRADVAEELQRLDSHIGAARELLADDGAVGRKLDFLAQEFNREANTLCSKASDIDITRAGLALKQVIDQLREQVQNIE